MKEESKDKKKKIKNIKDLREVFGKELIDEIMSSFHLKIYEFK